MSTSQSNSPPETESNISAEGKPPVPEGPIKASTDAPPSGSPSSKEGFAVKGSIHSDVQNLGEDTPAVAGKSPFEFGRYASKSKEEEGGISTYQSSFKCSERLNDVLYGFTEEEHCLVAHRELNKSDGGLLDALKALEYSCLSPYEDYEDVDDYDSRYDEY